MFTTWERWLQPHLPQGVGDEARGTEVVGAIVNVTEHQVSVETIRRNEALPDGSVTRVGATAHPSGDSAENLELVGAITDITQQRRAEAVIRTQGAELRDVIDTIPAIVWSALPDGSNWYVNSRFAEYCGMRPEQIAGTGWHVVTHPDDLERHKAKG